jgi:hypothetical protein
MHTLLPAAKALFQHFGLSALVIACDAQLYPRGWTFPTSIFEPKASLTL